MIALIVCAVMARRSKRSISEDVSLLLIALLPPIVGNMILIMSSDWLLSNIGCYIYFIGLDFSVIVLLRFSADYCNIPYFGTRWRILANAIIAADVVQLLLNPLTGHAFTTMPIMVEGAVYYSLVPLAGQALHRIVAYGVFFVSVAIMAYKTVTAARIYIERYFVILVSMVVCGAWETYYIFSGAPIDRSMIGFGVFGLLVYFFAIRYRPRRLLDRMLARIVSGMNAGVFFFDASDTCIYGNRLARQFIGLDEEEAIPEDVSDLISDLIGGWHGGFNQDWHKQVTRGKGADVRYFDVNTQQVFDHKNRHVGTSLSVRDATEETSKLQHEKYLATHDQLTGIYNQRYLLERMREEIDAHPKTKYVVGCVDVKDFKIINDIYSKEYGDEILRTIANVMRDNAVKGGAYGRLTGDKFGFLMPADKFSAPKMEELLRYFTFGRMAVSYPIVVHMGVYEVVNRDLLISVMFDRAFMALDTIKQDFNTLVAFYDEGMRDDLVWAQKISQELEGAMKERQIRPYLQPLVDANGRVEGAEVLVRWVHPEEGLLAPARFIPVFENNGMIAKLDMYMWECACEILSDWAERGIDMFLSVNISPKDFYFIDVYDAISGIVKKHGIDPSKLRVEITENIMMTDLQNRLRIIESLRSDGFLVEMDDFGSGYSSLNMLKDIPVDVLKIDMMFLYKAKDASKAETILQTIINLSGQLGIPSITEGVETADQLDMLVNMGCQMFQGYYFARPMPVAEFEERYRAA